MRPKTFCALSMSVQAGNNVPSSWTNSDNCKIYLKFLQNPWTFLLSWIQWLIIMALFFRISFSKKELILQACLHFVLFWPIAFEKALLKSFFMHHFSTTPLAIHLALVGLISAFHSALVTSLNYTVFEKVCLEFPAPAQLRTVYSIVWVCCENCTKLEVRDKSTSLVFFCAARNHMPAVYVVHSSTDYEKLLDVVEWSDETNFGHTNR